MLAVMNYLNSRFSRMAGKRALLIITLLITWLQSISQSVEWSNQSKVKSKNNYSQVLGENSSGVYVLRGRTNDFHRDVIAEKYKSNLALEMSQELILAANNILEKILLLENGMLMFVSTKSNITGKIELNCFKLDLNYKVVSEALPVCMVSPALFQDNSEFNIRQSADKSKVTVTYLTSSEDKASARLHVLGFTDQLAKLYKTEFVIDQEVEDIVMTSVETNNDGDVFTLLDFPKDKTKKRKEKDPRIFFMYAYYQATDKMMQYEIGEEGANIYELGMAVNNFHKSVTITGFYSKENIERADGEFYYLVDAAKAAVTAKRFEDFPKSFVSRVVSNMQNESGVTMTDLYIRKIIPRSDGGCLVMAEKYYETRQSYTYYVNGFPQTNYRVIYNYDQVVLISKNPDGSTQFLDFVKKNQSTVSDGGYYSSFVPIIGNDRVGLVYNSDATNDGDVMLTTISNKGVSDTKVLIKALSYYVLIMPSEAKQISANSTLICTSKDKRFSLMRITF
jgi:hypothetical protein